MTSVDRRAWLSWTPATGSYAGYAEGGRGPERADGMTFDDGLRWAAERSASVLVQPHWDHDTIYAAGAGADGAYPPLVRPDGDVAEPPPRVDGVTLSGTFANCAHCGWQALVGNRAELLAVYERHAAADHADHADR